jgi:hypothetical protein
MSSYREEDFWTRNTVIGAVVTSIVGIGVLIGLVRRARRKPPLPPKNLVEKVAEVAREVVGDDPLQTGQALLAEQLMPVLKPVLLTMLTDLEKRVDEAFKQAEQAVKKL